ncbi:S-layer homology domain-containing protein [Thermophilibacter sp. ET337]|uniref:S-layer homology domain-containing protein n=1 Tax=Thermophilibacter sp. ET337 TaxID=2973084 RepID=UPI0021ABCF3C|nr:S-layer homology domain-containing protein [Thermophilibacter sp. ET337]MCR8908849.1 S-layer homology domain-containing protein [Thermophilibacter sp. ET337]
MARRTWWKVGALLAAMMVFLTMLPATALAAAPGGQVIYVGNKNVTNGGYWTTDSDGSVTQYTKEGTPSDKYIHYSADTNTLTLHNATIREYVPSDTSTYVMGAGIGVFNQNGDAELTITLEGTNTIEDVSTGIFVLAHSPSTGDATLTITGSDSLDASGSLNGIMVQSNSGDATLTIQSADVTLTSNSGNGVTVQAGSAGTHGHTATLTVNGGKLTASGAAGIEFNAGNPNYNITTELTVSGNALVDTRNGGIDVFGQGDVTPTVADNATNGGIVFDGTEGTVYGTVTFQEDLEIGEGETLTIGDGASLDTNGKTITVESGGKLEGTIDGKQPPEITVSPVNQTMEEGSPAAFSVTASAGEGEQLTYQWQQKTTDSGSEWMDISDATNATYTTGQTTMAMSGYQYRCVVTANGVSVISAPATLTVNAAATTITTQPGNVTVTEGETATFSVTATGSNLTYQWQQSTDGSAWANISGATGISYTTQATTMDMSGYQYRCVVTDGNSTDVTSQAATLTVTAATVSVTGVTLNKTSANLTVGGTVILNATITPSEATNKNVTWSSDNTSVATVDADGKVTAAGAGTATITVTTADGNKTATCVVTVTYPYVPPRPTGPDWGDVADELSDAEPGSTVKVDMDGKTVLPGEVLDELAGRDVTLALDMGGGLIWEIYGGDVPKSEGYDDVDLGVALGGDDIPADVVNLVTGESGSVQVSLEHDGPFGFELTLVAPLGEDSAGLVANLYRYDDEAGSLGYEATAQVDGEGVARLPFDHASSWLVALDSRSHALPFPDALEGEWYSEAVRWAWLGGIMRGNGDGTLRPADALTRSQMACLLHNAAGSPASPSAGLPGDCEAGSWYAGAVSWALGAGVMNGHGDGSFAPGGALTREEAACVLMNAAGLAGMDVSARADLSGFADAGDVSGWAREALSWAVAEGVMNGVGAGDGSLELQPARPCTRAEAAALLMNLARRAG